MKKVATRALAALALLACSLAAFAQPSNVEAVIVDGRFLKRDGKLTTIDMAQLARDAADTIERARKEASKEGADKGINELFTR